jgi:hypothetical protein
MIGIARYTFPQAEAIVLVMESGGCFMNARTFDTKLTACFVNTESAPFPPVTYNIVSRLLAGLPWRGWVWGRLLCEIKCLLYFQGSDCRLEQLRERL